MFIASPIERNGTGQPEPREWRRKRIEDGPKGAESRVASKAKDVPPGGTIALPRGRLSVPQTGEAALSLFVDSTMSVIS